MFIASAAIVLALPGCLARMRRKADTNWQKLLALAIDVISSAAQCVALVSFVDGCSNVIPDKRHDDPGVAVTFTSGYAPPELLSFSLLCFYTDNSLCLDSYTLAFRACACFHPFALFLACPRLFSLYSFYVAILFSQVELQVMPGLLCSVRHTRFPSSLHPHPRRRQWLFVPRLLPRRQCDGCG